MSLNADQLAAVECDDPLLVVACPGSGKTHLTVEKIARILKKEPYAKVVGVSFTRDGAKELMQRVEKRYGSTKDRCYVSTFHSLALNHLKRNKVRIHIASNAEISNTVKRAVDSLGLEIHPVEAQGIIESCKSIPHFEPLNDDVGKLYTAYQEICQRNHIMDFFDVMLMSLRMIQDGSLPILGATHMLVDEFQDVDEVQYQYFMEHFRSGKVIPTAVGDDDQTIFNFRNALGYTGMTRFEKETKATRVTLGINYRCHREILNAADRLILHNINRLDKRLYAQKGRGGTVEYKHRFDSRRTEASFVADMIQSTIEQVRVNDVPVYKVRPSQWAVLARNNDLLDDIDSILKSRGIPYYRSGTTFWERTVPSLMLTVLKSMCRKERAGIEHLLHWSGVTVEDIDELRELIGDDWVAIYDVKQMNALDLSQFNPASKDIIKEFAIKIAGQAKRANKAGDEEVVRTVKGLADWMLSRTNNNSHIKHIELVKDVLSGMTGTLLERIQRVQQKPAEGPGVGVALSTMHSSKGLEFDHVWIVGVETDIIPSTRDGMPTEADVEDERKLMYVAMTRARNYLYLSSAVPRAPSQFIAEAFRD